ncbi:MAG: hypothetical protein Tsb009_08210 [Planctomycetaceae bacterium]
MESVGSGSFVGFTGIVLTSIEEMDNKLKNMMAWKWLNVSQNTRNVLQDPTRTSSNLNGHIVSWKKHAENQNVDMTLKSGRNSWNVQIDEK